MPTKRFQESPNLVFSALNILYGHLSPHKNISLKTTARPHSSVSCVSQSYGRCICCPGVFIELAAQISYKALQCFEVHSTQKVVCYSIPNTQSAMSLTTRGSFEVNECVGCPWRVSTGLALSPNFSASLVGKCSMHEV